jgi:hypothetical protein
MTRTLVWKEFREHWAVWLSLMLATAGGIAGIFGLISPGRNRDELLIGLMWFSSWGYGLVCGALLLAGETEEGTQMFLDCLPSTRRRLWRIKAVTGLCLLTLQTLAYIAIGHFAIQPPLLPFSMAIALNGILISGVIGYAWGLFSGSFSKNVINAIGWAALLFVIAGVALFPIVALVVWAFSEILPWFSSSRISEQDSQLFWLISLIGAAVLVAARSRTVYCQLDRLRARTLARPRAHVRPGWRVVFSLAWSQLRGFVLAMVGCAILLTVIVAVVRLSAWPPGTLLVGVICGVFTFANEQQSGAYRFLADQRLPLGRVWFVKVALCVSTGIAVLVLAALGQLAGLAIRSATAPIQDSQSISNAIRFDLVLGLLTEPVYFLALWFVYGYTAGLLLGMLIRKPIVACVVATTLAFPTAALWAPSLATGGELHAWQVLGVPAVLLIATRLLMRSWSSDTLLLPRALTITIAAVVVAAAWTVAALWYRAAEISAAPDVVDIAAFEASLPTPEENVGARLTVAGLNRLVRLEREFRREEEIRDRAAVTPDARRKLPPTYTAYTTQGSEVVAYGWKARTADLGLFLDKLFADAWARDLARAVDYPTGVFVDPRTTTINTLLPELNAVYSAAIWLGARGLQQQASGDPAAFVDHLRTGLSVSRNLRRKSVYLAAIVSANAERNMVAPVERWLERLNGRPDLLRRALTILQQQANEPPTDIEGARAAELLVLRNTFLDANNLPQSGSSFDPFAAGSLRSADLQRLSLEVPWESIRRRRSLDASVSRDATLVKSALSLSPPSVRSVIPIAVTNFDNNGLPRPETRCRTRASLLQVVLRLYQAEHGKPAESLAELVPEYLPSIPTDPYDHQPFRYRLSRGEVLNWPEDTFNPPTSGTPPDGKADKPSVAIPSKRIVPPGQGILWSVGEDRADDGGHTQQNVRAYQKPTGADAIFLVPLPPGSH